MECENALGLSVVLPVITKDILVYLKALVYTRDIRGICKNTKTFQLASDSRCMIQTHPDFSRAEH